MGRIAVFGGSFDPPHFGHIQLIVALQEAHRIDDVLIIPSQLNPLKSPVASPDHRLHMSHLAFDDVPGCRVLSLEMSRSSPSYTVDTLQWLMENMEGFRQKERFLFLGADVIPSLPQWKDIDDVFAMARPLFAARGGLDIKFLSGLSPALLQAVRDGWTETGLFDISSTTIRERIQKKMYVEHLVPEKVLRYIQSAKLYIENKE